jgi:hypothetical protein
LKKVWADPPTAVRFRVKKPAISALASFQKLSEQFQEICYLIGAKDLNLSVLKSFQEIQKLLALN